MLKTTLIKKYIKIIPFIISFTLLITSISYADSSIPYNKSDGLNVKIQSTQVEPIPLKQVKYWAYQIQGLYSPGAVAELVKQPYDMYVLEPTRTDWSDDVTMNFNTKAMVDRIKSSKASDGVHGKLVIAYVDIGQTENYRWYWQKSGWEKDWEPGDQPDFNVSSDPDWKGCYPVKFWDNKWKDIVIYGENQNASPQNYSSIMDEVIKDGFDGIYLDWVEGFDNEAVKAAADKKNMDSQNEMIRFIEEMREYANSKGKPDFIILQQNAGNICEGHPEIFDTVDGIAQEDTWYRGNGDTDWDNAGGYDIPTGEQETQGIMSYLDKYKGKGKPVFTIDYTVNHAEEVYKKANEMGYVPYCSRTALSKLTTTPPPDLPAKAKPVNSIAIGIPPKGQIYHGVYPGGVSGDEDDITPESLASYEKLAGKTAAWVYFSDNWFKGRNFPIDTVTWIRNSGSIPFIRLMLRSNMEENVAEPIFTLDRIINGEFDSDLRSWAKAARDFASPLLVEYGTEVNGKWFPWNGIWNGSSSTGSNNNTNSSNGPEKFKEAYRHIFRIMKDEGADNVIRVFHVNNRDDPNEPWNRLEEYYPGDEWVDWIGVSVYGAQKPSDSEYPQFRELMDEVYPRLSSLSSTKPIALLEFGVTSGHPYVNQADWANNALKDIIASRWPRLIGFSWWNETWDNEDNTVTNMRLQDNPNLAKVFNSWVGIQNKVLGRMLIELSRAQRRGETIASSQLIPSDMLSNLDTISYVTAKV